MRRSVFALAALATALVGGCAASTDERPAEFDYIVTTILRPGCATATCHSAMTNREGYDFSTVEAAAETFDRTGLAPPGFAADDTKLIRVLTTSGEERMPIDGPLPDADLELIRTWIADGAVR